ncbi:ParB N-terminal domain-containing protein [Roseibium sp. CAU 1637]|uniref:ParB N-terminal domain-containing protein n=1 Tax=Roseibium limicola TaxID=2816037 RepID=A0A939J5N7_9HYPH|nr:ParB N-terminal domain-containing protein [Roseibium limicola]
MTAYQSIRVSLIDIPKGRLREIDGDWADCLSGMFLETGQKTPIDVIATEKRFTLVAGAHRLCAARLAKWKEIDARILSPASEQAADELRLHEILENIARKDFNALERCEAFFEMKRIYEALHPQTKNGGKRGNQHTGGQKRQMAIFAFCQSAAETTGLSDRSVRLAVQIWEGLAPASRERLKGTPFAVRQSDLKALSDLDEDTQSKVLDILVGPVPRAASIADALVILHGRKPLTAAERIFRTVSDSLVKLPKASRTVLFRNHKDEIIDLARREGWFNA